MFKQLSKKIALLAFGIGAIASVGVVLSTTSCADNDPWKDLKVGSNINITSKKEAESLRTLAANKIVCVSANTPHDGSDKAQALANALTGNGDDALDIQSVFASSQIYWEIAYQLSWNWDKNHNQSLNFSKAIDVDTNGYTSFISVTKVGGQPQIATMKSGIDIKIKIGTKNETTYATSGTTVWSYLDNGTGSYKYQLNAGTNKLNSYALKIWD